MDWCQACGKSLPKPMMTNITDLSHNGLMCRRRCRTECNPFSIKRVSKLMYCSIQHRAKLFLLIVLYESIVCIMLWYMHWFVCVPCSCNKIKLTKINDWLSISLETINTIKRLLLAWIFYHDDDYLFAFRHHMASSGHMTGSSSATMISQPRPSDPAAHVSLETVQFTMAFDTTSFF